MKIVMIIILFFYTLEAKDIIFGVVPQHSPVKMMQRWLPIAEYLSKKTGFNIVFKTEMSIPQFEKELYEGNYDLAYMNPYHYIIAHKSRGYKAILRADKQIQGILIGPKEVSIFDPDLFRGKMFLFPAPNAFAATLLIKYELKKKFNFNIEKESKLQYVNSHDSVYKGVARGIGDFGGGIMRTYNTLKDVETKAGIKILYKSEVYPSHPIAIHPRLTQKEKEILENAFLSLPKNLLNVLNIRNLIYTQNSEYDDILQLSKELEIY